MNCVFSTLLTIYTTTVTILFIAAFLSYKEASEKLKKLIDTIYVLKRELKNKE